MKSLRQVLGTLTLIIDTRANSHRFCANPDVVLYVGNPAMAFHVEIDVVCDISPVLNAAFTGGYRETVEKTMNFPEENVDDFYRFINWTYIGRYQLSGFEADGTAPDRIMELAKLYTLADRYDVVRLKHNIIDRIYEIGQCSPPDYAPPHDVIRYVYENSTRLSCFRKLMVAWYHKVRDREHSASDLQLIKEIRELPTEMDIEARSRGLINPFLRDRRVFYEDVQRSWNPNPYLA